MEKCSLTLTKEINLHDTCTYVVFTKPQVNATEFVSDFGLDQVNPLVRIDVGNFICAHFRAESFSASVGLT
jgi:hypothetical protein